MAKKKSKKKESKKEESKKETSSGINWVNTIINSGIIGLFISMTLIYYKGETDNQLSVMEARRDSINEVQQHELKTLYLKEQDSLLKQFEQFKKELDLKNQIDVLSKELRDDIERIRVQADEEIGINKKQVEYNFKEILDKNKLDYISKQLSEFYWPILYRLEKNEAVYSMLGSSFVGNIVDSEIILPNHQQILEILEKNIYLAQPDKILTQEIRKYIAHVTMYQTLRNGDYGGFPEAYNGQDYEEVYFYDAMKERTKYLQDKYEILLDSNKLILHINNEIKYKGIPDSIYTSNNYLFAENKFEPKSINHSITYTEIKLSYNRQSYYSNIIFQTDKIIDTLSIAFKNYIPDSEFCILQIGLHKDVISNKGKNIHIRKNEPYTIEEFGKYYYRISLVEVWSEKPKFKPRRSKASLKVEQWVKNTHTNQ